MKMDLLDRVSLWKWLIRDSEQGIWHIYNAHRLCVLHIKHTWQQYSCHPCRQRFSEASGFMPAVHHGYKWPQWNAGFPVLGLSRMLRPADMLDLHRVLNWQALCLEADYNLQKVLHSRAHFSSKWKTVKLVDRQNQARLTLAWVWTANDFSRCECSLPPYCVLLWHINHFTPFPGGTGWDREQSRERLHTSVHKWEDAGLSSHGTSLKRDIINLFTTTLGNSKQQGMKVLLESREHSVSCSK